ncbi:MAG TPA: hypothetical protein VF624_03630 [Tepidisphaeraceae bacterium]|jgi:hypothetical protein
MTDFTILCLIFDTFSGSGSFYGCRQIRHTLPRSFIVLMPGAPAIQSDETDRRHVHGRARLAKALQRLGFDLPLGRIRPLDFDVPTRIE